MRLYSCPRAADEGLVNMLIITDYKMKPFFKLKGLWWKFCVLMMAIARMSACLVYARWRRSFLSYLVKRCVVRCLECGLLIPHSKNQVPVFIR